MLRQFLVAQPQAAVVIEVRQRPLHHVPPPARPAAVHGRPARLAAGLEQRPDPAGSHHPDRVREAVPGVAEQFARLNPRPAAGAGNGSPGQRVQQGVDLRFIPAVRRSGRHDQRHAGRVGQEVAFAALFAAVDGVRSRVRTRKRPARRRSRPRRFWRPHPRPSPVRAGPRRAGRAGRPRRSTPAGVASRRRRCRSPSPPATAATPVPPAARRSRRTGRPVRQPGAAAARVGRVRRQQGFNAPPECVGDQRDRRTTFGAASTSTEHIGR